MKQLVPLVVALMWSAACVESIDDDAAGQGAQAVTAGTGSGGPAPTAACPCTNPPYDCPTSLQCDTGCIGTGYHESVTRWVLAGTNYPVYGIGNQYTAVISQFSEFAFAIDALLHDIQGWHVGLGVVREDGIKSYDKAGAWTNRASWFNGQPDGLPERQLAAATWNHGRTINDDGLRSGTTDLGTVNANALRAFTFRTARNPNDVYRRGAIERCLSVAMTDGFCDRNCGNDAYTVPSAMHLGPADDEAQLAMFTNRQVYDGAGWRNWDYLKVGAGTYWVPFAIPTYGHNSNTDALAEAAMFSNCAAMASQIQGNCAPPANVDATLRGYVVGVCRNVCGMYRSGPGVLPSPEGNTALFDSGLGKKVGVGVLGGAGGQPYAGNYDATSWWGWGYQVEGM